MNLKIQLTMAITATIFLLTGISCSKSDTLVPSTLTTPTALSTVTASIGSLSTIPKTTIPTETLSNVAIITIIAQTPLPKIPPPNETGITPNQSTEVQVKELLGEPAYKNPYAGMTYWQWRNPKVPNLSAVFFLGGIVQQVTLETPNSTIETMVAQYSLPDAVVFWPGTEYRTPSAPGTPAPERPPSGYLLYLSKGIELRFVCMPNLFPSCPAVQSCTGVPRKVPVQDKTLSQCLFPNG